jgi:methionyl-tRNA synthetase
MPPKVPSVSVIKSSTRSKLDWTHPRCTYLNCRRWQHAKRFYATASAIPDEKPKFVTTPIFYVNASVYKSAHMHFDQWLIDAGPHVGHMYSMVLADVFKRWWMLCGKQARLCTGTDEHGMKVRTIKLIFEIRAII